MRGGAGPSQPGPSPGTEVGVCLFFVLLFEESTVLFCFVLFRINTHVVVSSHKWVPWRGWMVGD